MKKLCLTALAAIALVGCSDNKDEESAAAEPVRGVTDTEIRLGGMHDLSGVFAAFSSPAVQVANDMFEEVNEQGGIHGRKIRYIVEDHAYQVPKATQAVNKLVSRDEVFAMVMSLGTPHNLAAFPIMDRNNVPSILPLALSKPMEEQGDFRYRYVFGPSYYDGVLKGVNKLVETDGIENLCVMYIPSDFGEEVNQAATDAAANNDALNLLESSSHRPDESDFTGTLARLRDAGCELVAVALPVRPIITVVATAKQMGWDDAKFIVSQAGFHSAVAAAPGGVTEGLYGVASWEDIVSRMQHVPETQAWADEYKETYGELPSGGAVLGRVGAMVMINALRDAGPDLTTESFLDAMESLKFTDKVTGVDTQMSETNHRAGSGIILSQVKDGIWRPVAEME
ncbi:ABC transporter substrate-binding protein [Alcanivorax sp.]|uniref:ABC transporter substrate-binding protein n=1 Tax=Alcanivorax sp. TaxID=1872427 RepID=UPI000C10264F|nr:ABC transporter substrate-binding protein [Alcanivorax sp.]PHR66331.1 MAG: branched-chain amino acid ABC transporter substrate-binding protein [Alcanivorax sp.]